MMSREQRDRYLRRQDDLGRQAGRWLLIGLLVPGLAVIGLILRWLVSVWPIHV